MVEWFVYQYDVFPDEMDPDAMGIMLVPMYDAIGDIIYRDAADVANNCVRRIQSKWGIDPDIKQYDIVVRAKPQPQQQQQQQHVPRAGAGLPPLHSSASSQAGLSSGIVHPNPNPNPIANPTPNYSVRWFPTNQEFKCTNEVGGFQFENTTTKQCLAVSTNPHTLKKEVTLMGQDVYGKYSVCAANVNVIGVRIHKLALFSPGKKDKDASSTWFSKYVTAHTSAA
jgi:hypothetical protein